MDVIELTKELNQVNEDINWQEHSTCDESYQGWYVAGIHCDVASRVSVPLTGGYSVDNLMRMYDPIFDRQNHFHRDADDYYISPNFPDKHEPGYSSQAFWSKSGDMKCRLYYSIEDPIGASPPHELEMSFVCSDRAREAWFSLE